MAIDIDNLCCGSLLEFNSSSGCARPTPGGVDPNMGIACWDALQSFFLVEPDNPNNPCAVAAALIDFNESVVCFNALSDSVQIQDSETQNDDGTITIDSSVTFRANLNNFTWTWMKENLGKRVVLFAICGDNLIVHGLEGGLRLSTKTFDSGLAKGDQKGITGTFTNPCESFLLAQGTVSAMENLQTIFTNNP